LKLLQECCDGLAGFGRFGFGELTNRQVRSLHSPGHFKNFTCWEIATRTVLPVDVALKTCPPSFVENPVVPHFWGPRWRIRDSPAPCQWTSRKFSLGLNHSCSRSKTPSQRAKLLDHCTGVSCSPFPSGRRRLSQIV